VKSEMPSMSAAALNSSICSVLFWRSIILLKPVYVVWELRIFDRDSWRCALELCRPGFSHSKQDARHNHPYGVRLAGSFLLCTRRAQKEPRKDHEDGGSGAVRSGSRQQLTIGEPMARAEGVL
jgi:hypothetical protein